MKKNGGIINQLKSGVYFVIRYIVKLIATFSCSRRILNAIYIKLNPSQKGRFHHGFAKIFRNGKNRASSGKWKVVFANKSILMPLTSEQLWLDWDTAASIVGHDLEVKETYELLIKSPERPDLFIDIGANYGTHSLLFLVHQIKTITFEPNPSCHDYFRRICKLNQVTPDLEPVALGDKDGHVELSYPKHDTWLGSTNAEVAKELALTQELVTEKIEQKTVDDYFSKIGHSRTLIKIDAEGNELSVLRGAARTLMEKRPKIIFEVYNDGHRIELFDLFKSKNYRIFCLPWSPADKAQPLTFDQYKAAISSNFIAVPIFD